MPNGVNLQLSQFLHFSFASLRSPQMWHMKKFLPESFDVCRTTGVEHFVHRTIVSQSLQTVIGERPRRVVRMNKWALDSWFMTMRSRSEEHTSELQSQFPLLF